jgi:hypothetical protein
MSRDARAREAGELLVADDHGFLDRVGDGSQPGAEHDADSRSRAGARGEHGSGLLHV